MHGFRTMERPGAEFSFGVPDVVVTNVGALPSYWRSEGKVGAAAECDEVRSIQANGGVELKGVRWSSKAPRAGIETEVWAERDDGKSP